MLVRKRKNRSGSITVVVVDKSSGKFRERANFGSSSNPEEINRLVDKARDSILRYDGQQLLDFEGTSKAIEATEAFIGGIESELLNGPQLRIQGHHTTRPATSSSCNTRHVIILQDPPHHPVSILFLRLQLAGRRVCISSYYTT